MIMGWLFAIDYQTELKKKGSIKIFCRLGLVTRRENKAKDCDK